MFFEENKGYLGWFVSYHKCCVLEYLKKIETIICGILKCLYRYAIEYDQNNKKQLYEKVNGNSKTKKIRNIQISKTCIQTI